MKVTIGMNRGLVQRMIVMATQMQHQKNKIKEPMKPTAIELMAMSMEIEPTDKGYNFVFTKKGHFLGEKRIQMPWLS